MKIRRPGSMRNSSQDGIRAWVFLAVAFLGHAVTEGTCMCGSLLNAYLLEAFGESRSFTAVPFGLVTGVMHIGGICVTPVINRWGSHLALAVGGLLMAVGLLLSAFTPGIGFLILSYGLIAGMGMAFSFMALSVAVGELFHKYRTLALTVLSTGLIFGVMTEPSLVHLLTGWYSWRGSLLVLSGVALNLLIPAAMLQNHHPVLPVETLLSDVNGTVEVPIVNEKYHQNEDPTMQMLDNSNKSDKTKQNSDTVLFHWDILQNRVYIVILVAYFCRSLAKGAFYVHITAIGLSTVLPNLEAPYVLLVVGCVQLVARPTCGVIASLLHKRKLFIWSITAALSSVWIALGCYFTNSRAAFYGYLAGFGLNDGMIDALWAPVIVDAGGQQKMSTALGVAGLVYGTGMLTAPPIAGWLYDRFHSYNGTFILSGICCFVASILALIAAVLQLSEIQQSSKRNNNYTKNTHKRNTNDLEATTNMI